MSYILTLHVEEKGGQRRTHSYYFTLPNLMTGWRGEIEAEGEGKERRKSVTSVGWVALFGPPLDGNVLYLANVLATTPKEGPTLLPPPQKKSKLNIVLSF